MVQFFGPPCIYPWTFLSCLFLSFLFLSIHHAHQRRSRWPSTGDLIVGNNNWSRDLAHPSPNFHGGQRYEIWRRFQHHSILSCTRLKMLQGMQTLKKATQRWSSYVLAKFGEVGSTHPREPSVSCAPPHIIARRKRAKSAITQPQIIRFRSTFVRSLNAWHPKCCKSSRSRGQRSR